MDERMIVFQAGDFSLPLVKAELYRWIGAAPDLPAFDAYEAAWADAAARFRAVCAPRCCALADEGDVLTVFLTLGSGPEEAAEQAAAGRRYVAASLLNTMADQALFQMDMQAGRLLEQRLGREGWYIDRRMEAPLDYPIARQRALLAPIACAAGAEALPTGLFKPVKSMMYRLSLTRTPSKGQATHDCSRCEKAGCPYRGYRQSL